MELELCQIDPHNCSIDELNTEIARLKNLKEEYHGIEQSIKIFINSIYGATASPYFVGYNINVAEAVTLQGQDLIKFANTVLDEYFLKMWHKDEQLHKALGLTYVNPIQLKSLIVYNDTDSTYMTFKPVLDSCDWKGDEKEFILKMKDLRIDAYLSKRFEQYAEGYNTKDLQVLELEKISYSALMVAKKKYILDLAWKDPGVSFDPQAKIKPTGIEIVQGSTPKFARTTLKALLKVIFTEKNELKYGDMVTKLQEIKKEFKLQNPEDISLTKSIGDYEKYILEDKNELKLAPKCPINVRAAGIYNHKLLNSKWKTKYNLLRTGDKLKYFYVNTPIKEENAFGFLPGNFPGEIAPEIDYDLQFEKTIIEPINRYLMAMGYNAIPGHLAFNTELF